MYFFVMGNISGRQQGIQAGHAALEYSIYHGNSDEYKDFVNNHKTFILLDGGGSEAMIKRIEEIHNFKIPCALFTEPDLGNSVSAIAFILPDTVYNYDTSPPDYESSEEFNINAWIKGFKLASN